MNDYVLNLGFVAFGHWWQFIAFAILFIMYIVMNVLPASVLLASFVKRKQNLIQLPFFLVFTLTPIVGTLVGRFFYDVPALKAHSFRGGMKTQTDASRYII